MIKSLRIRNFRNHKDTTLRFGELTAIAGPNGVGKSNALRALFDFSNTSKNSRKYDNDKGSFSQIALKSNVLEIAHNDSFTAPHIVELYKKFGSPDVFEKHGGAAEISSSGMIGFREFLNDWKYLKPKTDNLSPSYSEEVYPTLGESGGQLASVIAHMLTTDRKSFVDLLSAYKEVVPHVEDIRATREKVSRVRKKSVKIDDREIVYDEPDEVVGDCLLFDTKTGGNLKAHQMSEGSLLILVIVTALLQNNNPKVMLIDDIESGLHPKAQEQIIEFLREIIKNHKDLQIFFTTHSPYILNGLEAEEINVLTSDADGYCMAELLSNHPKAKEALKHMQPGELWSAEGEAWIEKLLY